MIVNKQEKVCFRIVKYEDVVLCDVIPMEASHLLFGRPWQVDRRTNHNRYSNKYSFVHHGKKVILAQLSPSEVREDQKKLREKYEQERKESERKEVEEKENCERKEKEKENKNESEKEKVDKRESEKGIIVDKNESLMNRENEGGKYNSQGGENPTNSINQNEEFSKVEISCDEFYRVIFDPKGSQSINARSNSLKDGEYDDILLSLSWQ